MELSLNIFLTFLLATLVVSVLGQAGGYGRRRRPAPGPDSRPCIWGSVGTCGGFIGAVCPQGSTCNLIRPTPAAGLCCRDRPEPQQNSCPYGISGGSCDIFNRQCIPGYSCNIEPGRIHGTCCEDQEQTCPYGQNGVCGTIFGRICEPGTTCMFQGNFPDAGGKCCNNRPVSNEGTCPPPSGRAGICAFDPRVNCLSNSDCRRRGKICCQEGCGKVCKTPVYGPEPITY